MLILGSMLWRTTGVGAPPVPPTPPPQPDQARPSGGFPASDRKRSREEISQARQRFGLNDEAAAEAIAEVAARQAERNEQDHQKQFDELYRELELKRIEFDARYLEALGAMREAFVKQYRVQRQEEEELMILMLLAAAVAS